MKNDIITINEKNIRDKIYTIRGVKVMLDFHLAEIYGYETRYFNRQVKNNIEKFDDDFMFQLTREELEKILMCKNFTSRNTTYFSGQSGGTRKLPYAFTEQGIYMLMTVLKGDLAIKQSKALIRLFKEMKDYIIENRSLITECDITKLALRTSNNANEIAWIKENMVTKKEFVKVIKDLSKDISKEYLILNGKKVEASLAYNKIYKSAKKSIYIIDNYISLKTLVLLKDINPNVNVSIFSDNIKKSLHKLEYLDFIKEYPNINIDFRKANGIYHDRFIVIDYNTKDEKIFLCGSSSKDSGNKITTIMEFSKRDIFSSLIDNLLNNEKLVLS